MIGYKRVNFFELCRLCTTYEGCKTPIFDGDGKTTEIAEKIRGCLQIEVKLTDSLPKYICLECLRKLDKSYEFTTACRSSDATLQRHAEMLISDGESPGHELMVYVKDNKLSDAGTAKKPFIPKCVPIEESTVSVPSVVAPFSLELSEVVESEVVLDNAGEIYVEGNSDSFISKGVLLKNVAQILAEKSVGSSEEAEVEAEFEPEPDVDEGIIPMTEQEREWELKRHDEGFLTYCPSREGKDSDEPRVMHECEVCSKQFKRKEHLTQHRRLHTGERPFKCDYCDKSFNRKEHLVRHARSHTGEKCYSCDVCSRGFSRKDNLRKHQATHEPIAGECVSKRNRDFLKLVDVSDDGEGRTLLSSSTKRVKQEVLEDNMQAESSILILNDSGNELIQLDGKQSILLKALTQES